MDDCETDEPETRAERIAALMMASAAAGRLHGTAYHERAHRYINKLLDDLVGR